MDKNTAVMLTPKIFAAMLCLALVPAMASSKMCTLDAVPAASLLLPYFEVDLDNVDGVTTIFSINNASPEPTLAHVILWTDWAAPTVSFDIFLTGYDTQAINMREVMSGNLPITADQQSDPSDTTSPHGQTEWDGNFTGCDQIFPLSNPALQGPSLDRVVNGHTGAQISMGVDLCLGQDHGDNVARGYITLDNVRACSDTLDPGSVSYFDNGAGIATNDNRLWGEYSYLDNTGVKTISTFPLVHIEAEAGFGADSTQTGATFYGTYLSGTGADNREPLGTTWGARYIRAKAGDVTEYFAWRDTTEGTVINAGVSCGDGPNWYPLDEDQVICFSESEDAYESCVGAESQCFPLATQRTTSDEVAPVYDFGWCRMNLNHTCPTCDPGGFGELNGIAQSFVAVRYDDSARYVSGLSAVEMSHACDDESPILPPDLPPME